MESGDAADIADAKAYLLQTSTVSGLNVYDHLASVISKLLDERPPNAVDVVETVSQTLKSDGHQQTGLKETPAIAGQVKLASHQQALFKRGDPDDAPDEDATPVVPNVIESSRFFEDAGVGLGRNETLRVALALKALAAEKPLRSVRFWGKIFGTKMNYVVAECEWQEGEEPQPEEAADEDAADDEEEPEGWAPPKSKFVAPPAAPAEEYGQGVNKKVYFVCNEPGGPWELLPNARPECIAVARQIKKFFTGDLTTKIKSYPPFKGNEADLLRAQIARISAATQLAPLGLFTFDEEDEGDDEDDGRDTFVADEEFEGVPNSALMDTAGWAHCSLHIKKQGRCKEWFPEKEEKDEDDEDEDAAEEEEPEKEVGPPLLTPAQNDEEVEGMAAFTIRATSELVPAFAGVVASSNRWPGAHSLAYNKGKQFENLYIGWGHKYQDEPYSPPVPPVPMSEYPTDEAITETVDPTVEEEEAERAKAEVNEDEDEDGDED